MARPRTTSDEAIMLAVQRAVGRHGPAKLTLAGVAEEARLSPATLVQRFGSKRGLLLAFAQHNTEAVQAIFEQSRRAHRSPLAAMYAALANLTTGVQTPAELANNLGFLQMDLTDPQLRDHAAAHARRIHEELVALLGEAVKAGELAAGVDAVRLARLVQVTYNGALILWTLTESDSLVGALRAIFHDLIAPYEP